MPIININLADYMYIIGMIWILEKNEFHFHLCMLKIFEKRVYFLILNTSIQSSSIPPIDAKQHKLDILFNGDVYLS